MRKLLAIFTWSSSRSLGQGSLWRVSQRKKIHPLHWSQATGKIGTFTQQDDEPFSDRPTRTQFCNPVQKSIRHACGLLIQTSGHQQRPHHGCLWPISTWTGWTPMRRGICPKHSVIRPEQKMAKSFVKEECQSVPWTDQENVSQKRGHSLGPTHWLQPPLDRTCTAEEIPKRSSMRSP